MDCDFEPYPFASNPYARTEVFDDEEAEDELDRAAKLLEHAGLASEEGMEYWAAIYAARSLHHFLEAFEYAPSGEVEFAAREGMYRAAGRLALHRRGFLEGG